MVNTFHFIFVIRRSEDISSKVYELLDSGKDGDFDINGYHLHFDSSRKIVSVTDNGNDKGMSVKFIPAEISFRSLKEIIEGNLSDEALEIKFIK